MMSLQPMPESYHSAMRSAGEFCPPVGFSRMMGIVDRELAEWCQPANRWTGVDSGRNAYPRIVANGCGLLRD